MLRLFRDIATEIRKYEPQVQSIDIYKRQLEDEDEYNSIVVPGVLIALPNIDWQNLARHNQTGTGKVVVSVVLRLPAQTHDTDPLFVSNLSDLTIEECINNICMVELGFNRTATRTFSVLSYFVVEHTYEITLQYASSGQTTRPKPEPSVTLTLEDHAA